MRWVTLSHVHLDRAATPWLIRRFVDPEATFEFVEWGGDGTLPEPGTLSIPEGATPFAMPGAELGLHDADGTCFLKVMKKYDLGSDPALVAVERLVAAGVRHTFNHDPAPDETRAETTLGAALDVIGQGLGIAFDDAEHLAAAMTLYDAVYAKCRVDLLPEDVREAAPFLPPQKIPYLREALSESRR